MWLKTYLTCGFACSEYPASVLRNSGLRRCGSKIHLTCGSRSSSRCQRQCTISNEHGNDKAACEKHSLQSKAMQGTRVAVFVDTIFCMKSQPESRLACEVPCEPAKQKQKRIDIDRFPGTSWYWQYQDVISCSSNSSCEHNTHTHYIYSYKSSCTAPSSEWRSNSTESTRHFRSRKNYPTALCSCLFVSSTHESEH